jgi:antitoxin (DNA-binding transcriptional repressor) of toxin-antitoxin stability system
MRTITATEASRNYSDLLDAVEAGESGRITRGKEPVAEIRPAPPHTTRDLLAALATLPPLDDQFEADIADGLSCIVDEDEDPWAGK